MRDCVNQNNLDRSILTWDCDNLVLDKGPDHCCLIEIQTFLKTFYGSFSYFSVL